jgi:hypothetical protein
MPHSLNNKILRTISFAVVTAAGLSVGSMTASAASPEDEVARLNRVRENLFEELVKTRKEAASIRAELEITIKARDQAEAELARLKQEITAEKPATQPSDRQASIQSHKQPAPDISAPLRSRTTANPSQPGIKKAHPSKKGVMASARNPAMLVSQRQVIRATVPKSTAVQQIGAKDQSERGEMGWTGDMGGYGSADGALSNNGPGVW